MMSGSQIAREMAPMERLLKVASLLRDAHSNVVQRLRMIRENMMGPIPENSSETMATRDGSGTFGVLQDRLSEMDDMLNDVVGEISRIEKALGISSDCPAAPPTPSRLGR